MEMLMQTLTSIHTHAPMMGFPHSKANLRSSAYGMRLHSEDRVCMILDEMCPRVKALIQTCLRAFLDCHLGIETLRCEIFPSQSPALL